MAAIAASLLAALAVVGWTLPAWGGTVAMKALGLSDRGEAKYCTGQDTTGERKASVQRFEQANPNITVQLVEFPASADEQRNQFIQRQEARSADCDVFGPDVVGTPEFAQQKWLYDMTPYIETRKDEFIPSTPETTDGQPPDTWQPAYADATTRNRIVYQSARTTALRSTSSRSRAAGGTVLNEDGTEATINSPES
jgi:multiple sugar transport system substrate-binding protein